VQLIEYGAKVFGEPFDPESVIEESVVTPEQFLAGAGVRYAGTPGSETRDVLNPLQYGIPSEYLVAQRRLWFGDAPGTPDSDDWRISLAEQLRAHGFLRRLLSATRSGAVDVDEPIKRIGATLPSYVSPDPHYVELVVGSFLALISAARIPGPREPQPMMQVRYQFWMRELARIVSRVGPAPLWAFAADLKRNCALARL
jgi:DEAD/DEAH box helicase domain-containing protein